MNRRATLRELGLLAEALRVWHPYMFHGGLPEKHRLRPDRFNRDALAIGVGVEMEHTCCPAIALEIAMAHLFEDRMYYAKLRMAGL